MPDSAQMRVFHAAEERIPKPEDSLAERMGFELTGDFVADPTGLFSGRHSLTGLGESESGQGSRQD